MSPGSRSVPNKPHCPTVKHSRGGSDAPPAPAGKGSDGVKEKQPQRRGTEQFGGASASSATFLT